MKRAQTPDQVYLVAYRQYFSWDWRISCLSFFAWKQYFWTQSSCSERNCFTSYAAISWQVKLHYGACCSCISIAIWVRLMVCYVIILYNNIQERFLWSPWKRWNYRVFEWSDNTSPLYIKSLVQELTKPQVFSSLLDLVIHDRLVSHKFTVECT